MCGISGIYCKNGKIEELKRAIGRMNQFQSRRGPDDAGIFIDSFKRQSASILLGHRRLSIIDLSKNGHQPMVWQKDSILRMSDVPNRTSDIQTLVITYNGEIYNFLELKKELEKKGYKFKTKTDTEVILALYAEYGEKSFSLLRGMFAFGLWDNRNHKLFLVKDRYGIKPLYYYSDNEKLIFASTVKAIIGSGLIPVKKNSKALIAFLLFGSVPLPITTVKNIAAVPAGHYLVREENGQQKLIKYYEPLIAFQNKKKVDFEEAKNNIFSILKEAVNLHLISDAPLGIFLSGGLDSSTLATLAAIQREKPITTLSVVFEEEEFSEKPYQDLVAQKIRSIHREIKLTANDFFDSFENIFEAMDQPTIDGVNSFFIAKAAKEAGLKTVLSGLGTDEIFCGYPAFKRAAAIKKIQKLFSIFGRRTSLGRPTSLILNLLGDRYSKLSYFANDDILSFYLGIRGLFAPQEVAKILDINESEVKDFIINIETSDVPNIGGNFRTSDVQRLDPVDFLSYLELKFYLQNQLLKDTDFMSMYHSIEVRVPFLDHLLVEYLSGLPSALKLDRTINKPLLVEAVRNLLPEEILTRRKMGFTFPFAKWLNQLPAYLTPSQFMADDLMKKFRAGKIHWSRFWASMVLNYFDI